MTEAPPKEESLDELLAIEKQLDRSFLASIAALLVVLAWPLLLRVMLQRGAVGAGAASYLLALAVLVGCYLWFAVGVGRAARAVDGNVLAFVLWVLLAPLLSLVPIPIVSSVLLASPLSLKFLLSGRLRAKIHARTFDA